MAAPTPDTVCSAFLGSTLIASGDVRSVALAVKSVLDADPAAVLVVLDDATALPVELDLRGSADEVVARLPVADEPADPAPRAPGRPRLGVVAREVTLLPRHWEWLSAQPGGASVTLRKLVEAARRDGADADRVRIARDVTYRFAQTMAGDQPGFEEATRALYAGDRDGFEARTSEWPPDVREHALRLAAACW